MEVKILSQENGMAQVSVKLTGTALTRELDKVYTKYQEKPEFALPRTGLDTNPDGSALLREAVQTLFTDIYQDVMAQVSLPVASEPKVAVIAADETNGAEFTLTFALRPEIKLGRYKGIRVKMPATVPSQEEYDAAIVAAEAQNTEMVDTGIPARLGDIAVIDYTGYHNGEAFAGGAGTDFPLTLGSGQFIPGFEDQLVGASEGDSVDVNVTFPEAYHAANLAGQPALFRVQVKKIQAQRPAPLTEAQKQQIRIQVEQQKKLSADQQIEDQVLSIILEEAQVDLPEAMIESEANICVQQFAAEISSKNMSIDQFCRQTGKTIDGIRLEMYPLARRRIQLRMVLSAIAQIEGIEATENELERCWDDMAIQYGMPKEQLRQFAGSDMDAE